MTDPDLARLCFIHSEQNVTSDGKLMSVQLYKMKITRLFLKKENFDGLLLYTVLENSYSLNCEGSTIIAVPDVGPTSTSLLTFLLSKN